MKFKKLKEYVKPTKPESYNIEIKVPEEYVTLFYRICEKINRKVKLNKNEKKFVRILKCH